MCVHVGMLVALLPVLEWPRPNRGEPRSPQSTVIRPEMTTRGFVLGSKICGFCTRVLGACPMKHGGSLMCLVGNQMR